MISTVELDPLALLPFMTVVAIGMMYPQSFGLPDPTAAYWLRDTDTLTWEEFNVYFGKMCAL